MRLRLMPALAAVMVLAACSEASDEPAADEAAPQNEFGLYEATEGEPQRVAAMSVAEPERGQSESGPDKLDAGAGLDAQQVGDVGRPPQIAYVYDYGFRISGDKIAPLQQRHADLCEAKGPYVCRIISMAQSGDEGEYGNGTLELAVVSDKARGFGKELAKAAEDAEGEQINAAISGEDLAKQIVDTEARLRARKLLRDRLMEVLATRRGTVTELVEAERGVAQVNEEIDQATSWLSEMRGRVAFSRLNISYDIRRAERGRVPRTDPRRGGQCRLDPRLDRRDADPCAGGRRAAGGARLARTVRLGEGEAEPSGRCVPAQRRGSGRLVALRVAAFARDTDHQPLECLAQHDLAREAAGAFDRGGEVEHVLLVFARGGELREPVGIDDDMAGRAGHLALAGPFERHVRPPAPLRAARCLPRPRLRPGLPSAVMKVTLTIIALLARRVDRPRRPRRVLPAWYSAPKPSRIDDFRLGIAEPDRAQHMAGAARAAGAGRAGGEGDVAQIAHQPGDVEAFAAQVEVALPARGLAAVERPAGEDVAGAVPQAVDMRGVLRRSAPPPASPPRRTHAQSAG